MANRTAVPVVAALSALAGAGCIDSFGGSNIQASYESYVGTPGTHESGILITESQARPPAGTYMAWYAVDFVYQRDDNGDVVLDDNGEPVVEDSFAFELRRFEIQPAIDTGSPCFIDLENDSEPNFPGLHATQYENKLSLVTGIPPLEPDQSGELPVPEDAPEGDVIDMLGARRRMDLLPTIETRIKAVSSFSTARYSDQVAVADTCVEDDPGYDTSEIPPPDCIGDESNALRLQLCREFWAQNPDYYEGSDKVFTLPLNGRWFGAVNATNPINELSFINGASMNVDGALEEFDAILLNYQYKDFDGDGSPDYPDGVQPSPIGFHYMSGTPQERTREVINVPMRNRIFNRISAEVAIFPELDDDDVHF